MTRRSLLLAAAPALLPGATALTGRWRSVTTTKGGIGAVYDFQAGGRATYSSCALVEMPYQLEGDQLNIGGQPVGVGWHPDGRLQLNFGQNHLEDYTRRGEASSANRLQGEWKGSRVMNGQRVPVTLQFRPGGQALLVMQLREYQGTYRATADGWTLALASLPARRISAADDQLIIQVVNGDPHPFRRF